MIDEIFHVFASMNSPLLVICLVLVVSVGVYLYDKEKNSVL